MDKLIKDKNDYESVLAEVEEILSKNPDAGTPLSNKLELLLLLLKEYEIKIMPKEFPTAIESILFRLEQQNLEVRDLIPYIGSRSKVSEVLSGKRKLTITMINALNKGLDIPLEALMKDETDYENQTIDWNKFPVNEMIKRQWITVNKRSNENLQNVLEKFVGSLGDKTSIFSYYKKTNLFRSSRKVDEYSLLAWNARVIYRAGLLKNTNKTKIDSDFIHSLLKLSIKDEGPRLAVDKLIKEGLPVIIEPHLPGTLLDGAAISSKSGPVIGLTLRHDRLDNFWFCLVHELAHIVLHMGKDKMSFYDDLDIRKTNDKNEIEADNFALELMIPKSKWDGSAAKDTMIQEAALDLAAELNISPAIVAGRMRFHFDNYSILKDLVGYNQVRKQFNEVGWNK